MEDEKIAMANFCHSQNDSHFPCNFRTHFHYCWCERLRFEKFFCFQNAQLTVVDHDYTHISMTHCKRNSELFSIKWLFHQKRELSWKHGMCSFVVNIFLYGDLPISFAPEVLMFNSLNLHLLMPTLLMKLQQRLCTENSFHKQWKSE